MDISFREFINIAEGKNVGIIYHFTRVSSIERMVETNFELASYHDYISFTRNYDMVNKNKHTNDLNKFLGDQRGARIVIDGTKLSNKYRIEPFLDITNGVQRDSGEAEERVKLESVKIDCCIKQIDYIEDSWSEAEKKKEIEMIHSKYPKIKVNFVKKFKRVKG